jgi:uncharacterized protein (DUF305 family)
MSINGISIPEAWRSLSATEEALVNLPADSLNAEQAAALVSADLAALVAIGSHGEPMRATAVLQVKPGTTLQDVLAAGERFLSMTSNELHGMVDPELLDGHGVVPFADPDNYLDLSAAGSLRMRLKVNGYSGAAPISAEIQSFECALSQLATEPVAVRVTGADHHFAAVAIGHHAQAQVAYAAELARVSPAAAFDVARTLVEDARRQIQKEERKAVGMRAAEEQSADGLSLELEVLGYVGQHEQSGATDREYIGPIVAKSELHVAQDLGRGQIIAHDVRRLDCVPSVGGTYSVRFSGGAGRVSSLAKAGAEVGR